MAKPLARKCPDCEGSLHEIKLIDKTGEYSRHDPLEYALPEAERSFWLGRYAVEGKVVAYMCDQCGRILLYGAAGRAVHLVQMALLDLGYQMPFL
jgi:hypothetical protein